MRPVRTSRPRRGPRERTSSDPNRRIFRVLPAARPSAARWKMVSTIRRASAPVTPPWQLRTVAARSALFNVETRSFLLLQGGRTWGIVRQWEVGGARGGGAGVRAGGAQARERRPLVGTVVRRRAAGKDPKFGGWFTSRPGPRRSASSGRPCGARLSLGSAQRCRPEVYTLRTSFSGPSGVRGTEGPAFPALCAALPAGVRAETGTTPRAGEARLPLGSAQRCRPEVRRSLPCAPPCPRGDAPRREPLHGLAMHAFRWAPPSSADRRRRSLPCAPPCPRAYGPRREPLHGLAMHAFRWAPPSGADRRSGVPCPVRRPAHGGTRRDGNHSTGWRGAVARSCGPRVPV